MMPCSEIEASQAVPSLCSNAPDFLHGLRILLSPSLFVTHAIPIVASTSLISSPLPIKGQWIFY